MALPTDLRLPDPVMLRPHLLAQGLTDRDIHRQTSSRAWVRIRTGAFVAAPTWDAADAETRLRWRGRAVVWQRGGRWALSHHCSLLEHGVPVWGVDLAEVHASRLGRGSGRHEAGVVNHCAELSAADVVEVGGVLCTEPIRALLELCAVGSVGSGLVAADALLRGGVTREQLWARHDGMDRWPGMQTAQLVLRMTDGRAGSPGESRARYACWRAGLPAPALQIPVSTRLGEFSVDLGWPDRGVVLEFDGAVKYRRHLRPGETVEQAVLREKDREDAIREVTGWIVLRVTWRDLDDVDAFGARVREAYARAARIRTAV